MLYYCNMDFLFKIEQYLSGKLPYKDGVKLYLDYGTNSILKNMFSTGEDDYCKKKLKTELDLILQKRKLQIISETKISNEQPTYQIFTESKKKGSINVEKLPPHLKTEYYKLAPIIREIAATNPTLIHLKTKEARFESAGRILDLVEKRKAIFVRLEYFQEHGEDHPYYKPLIEEIEVNNRISYYEAQYKLKILRSQKTRLKKKPARLKDYEKVCIEIDEMLKIIANGKK
jgi:hypothetical protein